MATASTFTSPSDLSVLKSSSKLSDNETCFSDGDLTTEIYDYVPTHPQTSSFHEFLTSGRAQNRMSRRNEADEEEEDDDDDSGESDSSEEEQIPVDFGLSFLFDDMELRQMLPHHDEIHEKAWDKILEESEKSDFQMLDGDPDGFCYYEPYLCALLGLQPDFLDRLKEMPPEDCDHLKICDWIITFLRNNYESASPANRSSPSKELLASIGFDPLSSSVETIMARAGSTQHHIDACEMAEIFIRDQFKYNILLSPEDSRFPLKDNYTNIWFQLPEQTSDEENDKVPVSHINIQNLVTVPSLASSSIRSILVGLVTKEDQNTVLFHGTDHQSACDILFRGIDLCQGRQKRDFSCGSGFYLTDSSEEALNWAKNTTAKPALLVFQVNRQEHLDNAKKLNLFENDQKWREIVSSFRSGKKTAKTRKSLCAYDLIEGPVGTMRRNDSTDEITFEPKPSSSQMCLISDDFAETFRKTLHSIIFLDIC